MKPRKIAQTQTMLAVIDTVCLDNVASIAVLIDNLRQNAVGLSDGRHNPQKKIAASDVPAFRGNRPGVGTVHSAAAVGGRLWVGIS